MELGRSDKIIFVRVNPDQICKIQSSHRARNWGQIKISWQLNNALNLIRIRNFLPFREEIGGTQLFRFAKGTF